MDRLAYRLHYERQLPHYQPPGAVMFLTWRLAGSLPRHILNQLKAEAEQARRELAQIEDPEERQQQVYRKQRQLFGRWDSFLDEAASGPTWLREPAVAEQVVESLHYRDGEVYDLDTFCVMPNHVHALFQPLECNEGEYHSLSSIMHSLKRYTAGTCNDVLGRKGQFWQRESYDHVVRDEPELDRIRRYIVNNPVRAGLVEDPADWPWTYAKYL